MAQNNEKYGKNLLEEEELMDKLPPRDLGKEVNLADKHNGGDDINMFHWPLNFVLPHELGGCGLPHFEAEKDVYGLFNIFASDARADLAVIEPRWTTKDEFKVTLVKNKALEYDNLEDVEVEEPYSALPRTSSNVVRESGETKVRKPAIFSK